MTILDEIVLRTTRDLRERRSRVPESELRSRPLFSRPRRRFEAALGSAGLSVIAEIKQASPSKGVIRADLDVSNVARQYDESGASAISVLTEPHYFQGHVDDLAAARSAASVPLLRKDFVVDPYQVVEARAFGGDAVLLIATCLEGAQLDELLCACVELGMDHLVEVYSHRDLSKIDFDRIAVLGVNSRDLHTFEVDLGRFAEIFLEIPDGVTRVAESGISDAADIETVIAAGANAILVGETLMRAADPGAALASLLATVKALEKQETAEGGS